MTVTAEAASARAARVRIRIGMACEAYGSLIGMPVSFIAAHESGGMRFRISAANSIRIAVTGDADGIGSLYIVARLATLDVTPCILCVPAAAGANRPACCESAAGMPCRLRIAVQRDRSVLRMTFDAERAGIMACRAIG